MFPPAIGAVCLLQTVLTQAREDSYCCKAAAVALAGQPAPRDACSLIQEWIQPQLCVAHSPACAQQTLPSRSMAFPTD